MGVQIDLAFLLQLVDRYDIWSLSEDPFLPDLDRFPLKRSDLVLI